MSGLPEDAIYLLLKTITKYALTTEVMRLITSQCFCGPAIIMSYTHKGKQHIHCLLVELTDKMHPVTIDECDSQYSTILKTGLIGKAPS